MTIVELLGNNMAKRRKALGISQKQMALNLKITQDALNRMEKGKIAPKMTRVEEIANLLSCPVAYLFRSEAEEDYSATFSEILQNVPDKGKEALINLVADAARIMRTGA